MGEVSLTGALRPVAGALSMALAARDAGFRRVYLPAGNADEAAYADGITVYPVPALGPLLAHLTHGQPLTPCPPPAPPAPADAALDFCHVLGQQAVKRALEIAAAGGHNVLLSGPPGSGKSMMAGRFAGILPPLSAEERLEVVRVCRRWAVGPRLPACRAGRCARPITPPRPRPWPAARPAPGGRPCRARSRSRTMACCFGRVPRVPQGCARGAAPAA